MSNEYTQTDFVLSLCCREKLAASKALMMKLKIGAGNEARTRDLNLGKIACQNAHNSDFPSKSKFFYWNGKNCSGRKDWLHDDSTAVPA